MIAQTKVIAEHPRSYDKGKCIENPEHVRKLLEFKRKARHHSHQHRVIQAIPSSTKLLNQAAQKGHCLRTIVRQLTVLLDSYGASEVEAAVVEALASKVPHSTAVRICLERRREARQLSTAIHLNIEDKRVNTLVIHPHRLSSYDALHEGEHHE